MKKRGISLIVLIVTIIVIIILAAVVILTLSKNNPIESAREAAFKEDVRTIQDQIEMYIASRYQKELNDFNKNELNISGEKLVSDFGMPVKYKDKIEVKEGKVVYIDEDEKEIGWANDLKIKIATVPRDWRKYIAEVTNDGVPIPKGFTFLEGSKEKGTVIEDKNHNEFVWIPVSPEKYEKDLDFPSYYDPTGESVLPEGIMDESKDVNKYGGFYIGRYEATTPNGEEETKINSEGKPTCQKDKVVWTNINYENSKKNAEKMYIGDDSSVLSGLITGKAWDSMCHFVESDITSINENSSLEDSRYYGNYSNSMEPANIKEFGKKQKAGFSENWKAKNIYDLAGNVCEWTNEVRYGPGRIWRGGAYNTTGEGWPISVRSGSASMTRDNIGFRIRLYIKTE